MSASANDLLTGVGTPGTATTLAAPGFTIGSTSITVTSTSNWPTNTGVVFSIDTFSLVNGVETQDVGSYCVFEGVVASATSITNLRKLYGTDQNYAAGSTTRVYITISSLWVGNLVSWGKAEHSQLTGVHALTSNSTLTSSKFITAINDINGNELLKVTPTALAVNELTVANAATGNNPSLSATGGDTDITMRLSGKGTGGVWVDQYQPYKFSVYGSVDASLGNQKVKLNNELYDTNNNYDNATNYRYVAPVAGFYQFNGAVTLIVTNNSLFQAALYKNGVIAKNGGTAYQISGGTQTIVSAVFGRIQLAATDYVELFVINSSGTFSVGSSAFQTFLEGSLSSIT